MSIETLRQIQTHGRREADASGDEQRLIVAAMQLYKKTPLYEPQPRVIDWFALTNEQRRPFLDQAERSTAAPGVSVPPVKASDAAHQQEKPAKDAPNLAQGFDGSSVRAGPNHSTIEIRYDTHEQAVAAHKFFNGLVDAAIAAEQKGPDHA